MFVLSSNNFHATNQCSLLLAPHKPSSSQPKNKRISYPVDIIHCLAVNFSFPFLGETISTTHCTSYHKSCHNCWKVKMLVDTKPLFLLSRHHGDTSLSSQNRSPPDIRWSTIRSCCIPSSSATTHANHPLEADTLLVSFINPLAAGTSQVRRGTCLTQCRQKGKAANSITMRKMESFFLFPCFSSPW